MYACVSEHYDLEDLMNLQILTNEILLEPHDK